MCCSINPDFKDKLPKNVDFFYNLKVKSVKGIVFRIGTKDTDILNDCIVTETELPNELVITQTSIVDHFPINYVKEIAKFNSFD